MISADLTVAMVRPGSLIVEALTQSFAHALSTAQLRRFARHVRSGTGICCGQLADWFVNPDHQCAAPEVLANETKIDFDAFRDDGIAIPEAWQITFTGLVLASDSRQRAWDFQDYDVAHGVSLCEYTEAIRASQTDQVAEAVQSACRIRRLKF